MANEDISVFTLSTGARCLTKETSLHQAQLSTMFPSLPSAATCLKASGIYAAGIYGLFSCSY